MSDKNLDSLLTAAGMEKRPFYRPGEVQRLLRISPGTLRRLCEEWTPSEHPDHSPDTLRSFYVGKHRRIAHDDINDYLSRNDAYSRMAG